MPLSVQIKSYLEILDLSSESQIDEAKLKKAYLKKSKIYHPDVCEDKYKDGVMFKKINEANNYIKENLSLVNDYLTNPNKYNYTNTSTNYTNQEYTYTNMDDLFSYIFRSYNTNKKYSEEEIKKIKKEQRKAKFKRRIYSFFGVIIGASMCFVTPFLGSMIIFISLASMF